MKRLFTILLSLVSVIAFGQAHYNPAQQPGFTFVVNKPFGESFPVALDARSEKADTVNGLYRPYNGTTEVLTYLNTTQSRTGWFPIVVNVGGSLQPNGTFIGGTIFPYWFLRGVADSQLVLMNTPGLTSFNGRTAAAVIPTTGDYTFAQIGSTPTTISGYGITDAVSLTGTQTLTNKSMSGLTNTFSNIPNSALSNSSIGLTVGTSGTDIGVGVTPAALGSSLVLNIPTAGTGTRGALSAANWNYFNSKVDSIHVSNDSLFDYKAGVGTFRGAFPGSSSVISVSNSDGTLTISPITGNVVASLNLGRANTWLNTQTFQGVIMAGQISFSANNTYSIGSGTQAAAHVWSRIFNSDASATLMSAVGNSASMSIGPSSGITLLSTGQAQLNNYTTSSSFTGTPLAFLQTDAFGNVIQTPVGNIQVLLGNEGVGYRLFDPVTNKMKSITCTGCTLDSLVSGQINITGTGVDTIYRTSGKDSIQFTIGGRYHSILDSAGGGGGSGTVTTVSVVTANGFAGSVATPTTTPAITISTSVNGLAFGNGTSLAAATVSSPLTYSAGTLAIQVANTSQNGYLSSTDWNTFNNKTGPQTFQQTLTTGNSLNKIDTINQAGFDLHFLGGGKPYVDSFIVTTSSAFTPPTAQFSTGNSITVGQGASVNTNGYAYLYANQQGLTITNNALSGSGAWYSAGSLYSNVNPGHSYLTTVMFGLNDIRRDSTDPRCRIKVLAGYLVAFYNQYLKVFYPANTTLSNVKRIGTWSPYQSNTVNGKAGANGGAYTTNANSDTLSYPFTDSTVLAGLIGTDSSAGFQYSEKIYFYIDGILSDSVNENNWTDGVSDGVNANHAMPFVWARRGLSYGSHTLKIVSKTAHSYPMVIDWVGNMNDKSFAYPLLVFEIPHMAPAGYGVSPSFATAVRIDTMNTKIDSLFNVIKAGYPVYIAKTNTHYTATAGVDVSGDNIHPNDLGHREIDTTGLIALPKTSLPGTQNEVANAGRLIQYFGNTSTPHVIADLDEVILKSQSGIAFLNQPGQTGNLYATNIIANAGTIIGGNSAGTTSTAQAFKFYTGGNSMLSAYKFTTDNYFFSSDTSYGATSTPLNIEAGTLRIGKYNGSITNYVVFDNANTYAFDLTGGLRASGKSAFSDTAALTARFSYNTDIGASFTRYTLVDKNYVDSSITAHGGTQTWQQTLTTGSTLNTTNTIVNTGQSFTWNNGGTGAFKFSGLLTDTTNAAYLLFKKKDSSIAEMTFANLATYLPPDTLNAINGLTITTTSSTNHSIGLGGTLSSNTTVSMSAFNMTFTGTQEGIAMGAAGYIQTTGAVAVSGWNRIIATGGVTEVANTHYAGNVLDDPPSAQTSFTFEMPQTPVDGEIVNLHAGGQIANGSAVTTSFTVTVHTGTGQVIFGATPSSTLTSGDYLSWKYYAAGNAWYREH